MDLSEFEINELLRQIAGGKSRRLSERAIETLYKNFNVVLRSYVWKNFFTDEGRIEEVIQDTFLEVWRHPDRFRGESTFKTWLIGVVRHKALDARRKESPRHEPIDDLEEVLPADTHTAIDQIEEEQIRQGLKFCLDSLSSLGKLSSAHREVLHLAYVEDLDVAEIAEIVVCPENTVKTRLHHARLKVKNCLQRRLRSESRYE